MNHFIYCMEQYWASYKELMLQQARERLELNHSYKVELAMGGEAAPVAPSSESAARMAQDAIETAAGWLIQELLAHAVSVFSPNPVTPLDLDFQEVVDRLGYQVRSVSFQPADLWRALEAKYGNGIGHSLAYQRRAESIGKYFSLSEGTEVPTKNGCMHLTRSIHYVEKSYSPPRLGHSESETLSLQVLPALASFATWAGMPGLAGDIAGLVPHFSHPTGVKSREAFNLGSVHEGRIKLVTYQTSFEWTFEPAVAEPLAIFLGEFYFAPLQAAA
ncbi:MULTISPECIES: hypothetical protein [Ralstonia]|jgi:hypothetical protein|uniref:Uncharacterized protein n=2 Tax=Ralstonia pickettii TaxID=329 RepID=R0DWE6_RALPI|nr:hypothetical protein [Ralstonia pickettii]ENZ77743.1 hypothetical protein OR214_02019 [Ralstonia pickettii OR214]